MNVKVIGVALSFGLLLASCKPSGHAGEAGQFAIGERAQVAYFVYNVIDTQWAVSLGKAPEERVPKNRFLIVNLSVVNSGGKEDHNVPTFTLVDDAGQTYTELDNGQGVPEFLGFTRKVRPAESLQGNILFDVAPKHYKLKVADELEQTYGLIDIPLNFGTPIPQIEGPNPGVK